MKKESIIIASSSSTWSVSAIQLTEEVPLDLMRNAVIRDCDRVSRRTETAVTGRQGELETASVELSGIIEIIRISSERGAIWHISVH